MAKANDWNAVRRELDKSDNFEAICNSPWYADAVYEKFSDAEYARRHEAARKLMARDGLDAVIFTGGPDIYSHGAGVTWGSGLFDERGMVQYLVLPRNGDPTLVYPHPGCHIEAARRMVSVRDVRGGDHGHYGRVVAERLIELGLEKGRIAITAADRTGPEFMGTNAWSQLQERLPRASFVFVPLLLHELAHRKSPEELRAMAKAGQLAVKALEAVKAVARPGVREYQLAAAVTHAVMNEGGRHHLLMIGSTSMADPKLIFPNPNPSHRVLKQGDIVLCELNMASAGPGSSSHFSGAAFMMAGGFTSLHVPYKGGGPSVAAVVAGESHWTMPPSAAVMTMVRAGRLRALGHSWPQRTPLLPDIPAISESLPGFKHVAFSGLLAPRGVPKPIMDKIRANVDRIVNTPETREQFALQGVEPTTGTPEEFRRAVQEELVEAGKLVKAIGLKAE